MNSQATQLDISDSLDEAVDILQCAERSLSELTTEQLLDSIEIAMELLSNVRISILKSNKLSFNQIPNEVLTLVLRRISLQKLVNLRSVCSRWKAAIQPLFDGKKSLKLLFTEKLPLYCNELDNLYPEHYKNMKLKPIGQDDDLLYVPSCSTLLLHCTIFPRLLPNVVHLVVYVDHIYAAIPKLLSMLPKLIHLSLYGIANCTKDDKLFVAINSLSALRSLDFFCNSCKTDSPIDSLAKLLPIARLEHLSTIALWSSDFNDCLDIVTKLSPQCKYLGLYSAMWDDLMPQLRTHSAKLANLTHFAVKVYDITFRPFLNSLKLFENLNYLNINMVSTRILRQNQTITLSRVLNQTAKLKHLQHLNILFDNIDLSNPPTTPLSTVKRLKLVSYCETVTIANSPNWCQTFAFLFPNLEQLTFNQTVESALGADHLLKLQGMLPRFKSYSTLSDIAYQMGRHKERYLNGLRNVDNLEKWNQSHFSNESKTN